MGAFADPHLFMLLIATVLRGLGAGIITGVELITLPSRRQLGTVRYARFMRTHYRGVGVRVYAATTVLGALMTVALWIEALSFGESAAEKAFISVSLASTILGFVGTAGAFPAMRRLWQTSDDDEVLVAALLDRFARWGLISAVGHVIAFIALALALALPR